MLFALGAVLELAIYLPRIWKTRLILAAVAVALISFATGLMAIDRISLATSLITIVSLFRIINLVRIAEGRMHEKFLRRVTLRTSLWLVFAQLLAGLLFVLEINRPEIFVVRNLMIVLVTTQLIAALVILITTMRSIKKTGYQPPLSRLADSELPTVTVAIPARNETPDLTSCLEAILANDYPKLEILVLDDCSQDDTSQIVKSFAQSGVRFVHGEEPKTNWLAKNQAYDQLSRQATGEYILFCGADVRLGVKTIRTLINLILVKNKQMVSVLPRHQDNGWLGSLIQPMRYWWELAVPRRFFNRPAVLSSCWLIKRKTILDNGGFAAVSRSVLPEGFFARRVVKDDGYSFVRSHGELQVTSLKNFGDQFNRAVRLRYPEIHRRLELIPLLTFGELALLLGPFVLTIVGIIQGDPLIFFPSLIAALCLTIAHSAVLKISSRLRLFIALINFPLVTLTEVALGLYSMLKYEFSTVDWKGRNICLPAMHYLPKKMTRKLASQTQV